MTMGTKRKGRPLIAFESEVEVEKNHAETIQHLHTLFEALNLIILGDARVWVLGNPDIAIFNDRHCLMEINRVLKEQGKLVVTVPNFSFSRFRIDSLMGRIPYVVSDQRHIQTFNRGLITKRLNESGFNVLQLIGTRIRLKFLLKISVSFFSETLIVLASKRKPRP